MQQLIPENFRHIQERVLQAARGRDVRIIAVSKTQPPAKLEEAYHSGLRTFGENRIQEAIPKVLALSKLDIEWHFIGHLQTNKVREALRNFSYIQAVDSIRLMQMIEKEAEKMAKKMPVLLELNLAGEITKHGMTADQLPETLEVSRSLRWVDVRGLMLIPPYFEDPEQVRPYFHQLRELRDQYARDHSSLTELSMGMSHDYVVAIEEGATMIRIGTALFGERNG